MMGSTLRLIHLPPLGQDIWAIIILAVQPKLPDVEILGLLKTFVMIAAHDMIITTHCYM